VLHKVGFEDFVLTKALRKDYSSPNHPHLTVVAKKKARREQPPGIGDRVAYVILESDDPNAKVFERAEDPDHALSNGLRIDRKYYVENQVMRPVCAMFRPLEPDPQALFKETLDDLDRQGKGVMCISNLVDVDQDEESVDVFALVDRGVKRTRHPPSGGPCGASSSKKRPRQRHMVVSSCTASDNAPLDCGDGDTTTGNTTVDIFSSIQASLPTTSRKHNVPSKRPKKQAGLGGQSKRPKIS
jgi:hypothetical protein